MGYMSDWNDRIRQHVFDGVEAVMADLADDLDPIAVAHQQHVGLGALLFEVVDRFVKDGSTKESLFREVASIFDAVSPQQQSQTTGSPAWLTAPEPVTASKITEIDETGRCAVDT